METRRSSNQSMHYMSESVHIHQIANESDIDLLTNGKVYRKRMIIDQSYCLGNGRKALLTRNEI